MSALTSDKTQLLSLNFHSHKVGSHSPLITQTERAFAQVKKKQCSLRANPLKWTECELPESLERLTSATFLTSCYQAYPAATLPLGHSSYAHTITNSHTCAQTHRYAAKGSLAPRSCSEKHQTGLVGLSPSCPAFLLQGSRERCGEKATGQK